MSNYCCITRFSAIRHNSGKPRCISMWGNRAWRSLSTCIAPDVSSSTPLIASSSTSLVRAVNFSPSDTPQLSEEWFALRKNHLTASTFSTVLRLSKGNRCVELWHEKVFESEMQKAEAMNWGVINEAAAIDRYRSITGRKVDSLGFAVHTKEQFNWLGASPDGVLGSFEGGGILEVKCPFNKGKSKTALPWSIVPFYYMPQVQGQMQILDREWVDLYCWIPNGSTLRDRDYWELIYDILREFWFENVMPAREALLLRGELEAKRHKPLSTHKQTGVVISKERKVS